VADCSGTPLPINTILFDFDGTLRHDQPEPARMIAAYLAVNGVEIDPDTYRRARRWEHYYWGRSPELAEDKEKFGEMDDRFWTNYIQRNLIAFDCSNETAAQFSPGVAAHMQDEYRPEDWVPPDTLPTLDALKGSGYKLALVSNRREPCHDRLEQVGLDGFFDMVLVAGEIDCWKPEPGIFHEALIRLDASPSQTAHIGDNFYTDVLGAQNAGLQPVLYDPEEVFPNPGCPVIQSLEGVLDLLDL